MKKQLLCKPTVAIPFRECGITGTKAKKTLHVMRAAKTKLALTVMLCFITTATLFSQTYCFTPAKTQYSLLNKSAAMSSSSFNGHYCLRVYFHVIRQANGTGGQTVAAVNQAYNILNQDFNPHNISFFWDSTIDYINTSSYNSPSASIFSVNNHADGIDIYLYPNSASGGGLANGVGDSSEFYVAGSFWNPPYNSLITSHVISHEMGHVLFLWHTHHGTVYEIGNDTGQCPELVNGSNSATCGDYCTDTPADPHIQFNVNPANCTWLGSGTDANGQTYNPDEHNIMSYTIPACMDYFTAQQGQRMRNAIQNLPYLQQTVLNCASCSAQQTADLMIRDTPEDTGEEPNTVSPYMWNSSDIWIRNQPDNIEQHQNPEYHPTTPRYVYVRVMNRNCTPSTGTEQLKLYWAKAGTSLDWDYSWIGNTFLNSPLLRGKPIGTLTIPVIPAGGETIVRFTWTDMPDPADYTNINEPWHFCLLARIESSADPMATPETTDVNANTANNNNIAWKNITVVDVEPNSFGRLGGIIAVENLLTSPKKYTLNFVADNAETGRRIFQEAEVSVALDDVLLNAWTRAGQTGTNVRLGSDRKSIIVTGDNASITLAFNPRETGLANVKFNFLTRETTEKVVFKYHAVQRDFDTRRIIGGETYEIIKHPRSLFFANAGEDITVNRNESITLAARLINESVRYNWYDESGSLIYQGADFTVSAEIAQKYKLEVISLSDGYKDYDEIKVELKPSSIESVVPNPAVNDLTVSYRINKGSSAYLSVVNVGNTAISSNYIVDVDETKAKIDISGYPQGTYIISLISNGTLVDSKTVIKK